jgi:anti-anti-sigma factor
MSALLVRTSIPQPPPTLVTVAGDIDIASAPSLRRHLLSIPDSSTVLDLSGVQLLSAAGLTELIDLRDRLTRADARLALAAAPRLVRRVLAITGLDDTMMLADTVDDAVHLVTTPIPPRPAATVVLRGPAVRGTPPPAPPTGVRTLAYLAAEQRARPTPRPAATEFTAAEPTSGLPRGAPAALTRSTPSRRPLNNAEGSI